MLCIPDFSVEVFTYIRQCARLFPTYYTDKGFYLMVAIYIFEILEIIDR